MSLTITTDEWLAALQEAMRPTEAPEGWKTATELARTMSVSLEKIRATLGELDAQGKLLRRFVMRPSIDGRLTRRPVYSIKPDEKAA